MMARHRNIRNAKSYDYEDDDYDMYGRSYEDDYGVSPGTMAQYSYSRCKGHSHGISSYIPAEETVEEENQLNSNSAHQSTNQEFLAHYENCDEAVLISCLEQIRDVVGENYSENTLRNAALKHSCDVEKSIDFLLTSTSTADETLLTSPISHTDNGMSSQDNYDSTNIPSTEAIPMPQRIQKDRQWNKTVDDEATVTKAFQANDPYQIKFVHTPTTIIFDDEDKPRTMNVNSSTKGGKNNNTSLDAETLQRLANNSAIARAPIKLTSNLPETLLPFTEDKSPVQEMESVSISTRRSSSIDVVSTPTKQNKKMFDYKAEYAKRRNDAKTKVSLVVIGHVDAGKSTMMGHLLFQKGVVSKKLIHKYEQESRKLGKASFAYAWVLDETGEERIRGVTMDIASNRFETDNHIVTLMDAPGHRDFIPNMITGAAQADVAVLVIGASTGEFEAGFGVGGQTREHALLVRTLGVSQLAVAVNKLDTLDWSKDRFEQIVGELKPFLKQAGFRDSDITFVPVSGLLGDNLTKKSTNVKLTSWYSGPSLLQVIDNFRTPLRAIDHPFRFTITDIFRMQGQGGISISGKVESGGVCPATKVAVMPGGERGLIKSVETGEESEEFALAGEHATLLLHGVDATNISTGSIICDADHSISVATRLQARIIVFSLEVPITNGFPVELHYKTTTQPATIRRIISLLHKTTGEVVARKPRFITKGANAMVEIQVSKPLCLEVYSKLKELGRFTLRYGGSTIAACVVTKLLI